MKHYLGEKMEKKVKKEMDSLLGFENHPIGEMKDLIESCIRTAYSTGAYDAAKEMFERRYGRKAKQ